MLEQIDVETPFDTVKSMLGFLLESKLITRREAEIIAQMSANLYQSEAAGEIASEERARLIRSVFVTLAKIT